MLAREKLQNLANGSTQEKYRIDRRKACRANPGNNANGYRASGGAWRCP